MSKLTSTERRAQLLDIACTIARKVGYLKVTREAIAAKADCSPATVTAYFKTTPQLKRDIMRAAVKLPDLVIIAQGLANKDPHAQKAPDDLKQKAVASLALG